MTQKWRCQDGGFSMNFRGKCAAAFAGSIILIKLPKGWHDIFRRRRHLRPVALERALPLWGSEVFRVRFRAAPVTLAKPAKPLGSACSSAPCLLAATSLCTCTRCTSSTGDRNDTRAAVRLLRDILRCRLLRHQDQVSYMAHQKWYLKENAFLGNRCKPSRACSSTAFVGKVCRMASLHVAKVLRLSLRWARPLLEDEDLDVQIIYMVRDPRAVFSSRARVDWCTSSTCRGIQTVCSLLGKDLAEAAALLQEYPHRFMFVQYEEMCQNMSASLADMMDFLGLPVTDVQKNMLRYESPSTDPHTIAKNSLLQAQLWRNLTSFEDIVVPVQDSCRASLEKLGLRIFSSYNELQNLSVPALIRPPVP
ncbi:carbohydrate sulfotransferase 1-like [Penaeus vannamei]|uniref:carbohydrate sulfotransferase 1-like n=1 Tax=Penaeus vannamei TaxID=6689 RepID=UPI00387F44BF